MNNRPLILITNDDGVHSPGLLALIEAAYGLGDLLVIAPENQQTNMGRGALAGENVGRIRIKKINTQIGQIESYAILGSPAQAVAHGILELSERTPDICLSGINYGENLGLAYTCSGTLGAAFEADSFGIRSIAFSRAIPFEKQRSNQFHKMDWEIVKSLARKIIFDAINEGIIYGARILNVNFPEFTEQETEMRITKQANMNCGKYVNPGNRDLNNALMLQWIKNSEISKAPEDTDIYAIHFDNVISLTPLTPIMSIPI
ncbi:5'/3'-nucleotidase SurE [Alkalibacter saccharofermentans]|uniref:5'-nucleotidase n=1 Tax=Alkalibacter saccharofermentans DSM 14828 TaxID=1120975 RepID=A0A1M4UWB4_9FIRM|nr:5'/3'-nucleotidase SurE [Alkalibacter saccharofermentans]SHE60984.1 5'-nucleotidase /3'-nucleotidase /exopolyphosphatase [Alkalibacter saccharofermentans DSM 14828]